MYSSNFGSNSRPGPQNSNPRDPRSEEFRNQLARGLNSQPGPQNSNPRDPRYEEFRDLLARGSNSQPGPQNSNPRDPRYEEFRDLLARGSNSQPGPQNSNPRDPRYEEFKDLLARGSNSQPGPENSNPRDPRYEEFRDLLARGSNSQPGPQNSNPRDPRCGEFRDQLARGSNSQPGPENSNPRDPSYEEVRDLLVRGSISRPGPQNSNPRDRSYEEFRDLLARDGVHPNVRDILHKYANMGKPKLPGESPNSYEDYLKDSSVIINPKTRDIFLQYVNYMKAQNTNTSSTEMPNSKDMNTPCFQDPTSAGTSDLGNLNPTSIPDCNLLKELLLKDAASTDKPFLKEIYTRYAGMVDQHTFNATKDPLFGDINLPRPQESNAIRTSNFRNVLSRYKNLPGLSTSYYPHEEGIEAVSKIALAQINASVEAKEKEVQQQGIAAVSKIALAQINASVEAKEKEAQEVHQQADTSGTDNVLEQQIDRNLPIESERERTQELPPYYGAFIHRIMQLEKFKYSNLLKVRSSLTDVDNLRLDVLERISAMLATRNREDEELEKNARAAADENKSE